MKRLKSLDVEEVSLVDIGANKKKFLIFKSKSGSKKMDFKKIAKSLRIRKSDEDDKEMAKKDLEGGDAEPKELSEGAQAAMKAVARILMPFKEELSPEDMGAVCESLGMSEGADSDLEKEKGDEDKDKMDMEKDKEGSEDLKKLFAIPEDVKEEHAAEALEKAKDAMGEHLEKLGYEKYKSEEPAMKSKEDEVEKSKYAHVFKSNQDLIKKNADLEKIVKSMQAKELDKELVQKAASFTHLGLSKDDVVEVLKEAKNVSEKHYEKVCKQYSALNEQAKKSNMFGEVGSRLSNNGASDAEAKIDAAVATIVKKAGVTKEQAYTDFMTTAEGKDLYREMKSTRPNGI